MTKALIVADGIHGPWNKGEAILARNFIDVIGNFYEEVVIISTVDRTRLIDQPMCTESIVPEYLRYKPPVGTVLYASKQGIKRIIKCELNKKKSDVHILHSLSINYLSLALRRSVFFYQFSYRTFGTPTIRMYVAPILASAGRLIILTTCLKNYKYLNRFFRRNYHYVPVPLTIPYYRKRYNEMKGNPLRVICITHPTYKRFPYIELFKVLKKLRNDGYKIILRVYFSKIRSTYSDYASFVKRVASNIKKLDIADTVKLHVLNLSEEEKYKVLADNDVFLYPALEEVAVDPPLTVLEAMATGCCVISTSVQSCSLILNHSRGILFSPRNFETEIDEALRRIIDEPRLIPLYGFAARMYIRFFHDREKVSKHIAEIIHDFAI